METHVSAHVYLNNEKDLSHVSHISISQRHDGHHFFEVRFALEATEGEKNITIDKTKEYIGKPIKISISASQDGKSLNEYHGIVTNITLSRNSGSHSEAIVSGHSATILLEDGKNTRSFQEKTVSQIVNDVLSPYPKNDLSSTVNVSPDAKLDFEVQYNETNFNFLTRLANRFGLWFYHNGKDLVFGKKKDLSEIELVFGSDLEQFNLGINLMPQKFKTSSYDYVNNKPYEVSSGSIEVSGLDSLGDFASKQSNQLFSQEPVTIPVPIFKNQDELKTYTTSLKSGIAGGFVVFSGTSYKPQLSIGTKIKVETHSGDYQKVSYGSYTVINITHSVNEIGAYINKFDAIPSTVNSPPANHNYHDPVCETQPAKVYKNNDDDGYGRVKVQFYWQKDNLSTPWIRLLNHHAGKDKGFQFIPEVGDEVLVAFENGNPSRPYVLGGLYHGKASHTDRKDDDNYIKTIRTVSGNEIKFFDKSGEEEIHIFNKDKQNEISLTLKDDGKILIKSKNKMMLQAKEIAIEAEEKISMKAKEITIEGQQKVAIKTEKDFSVDSMNSKINANQNVDIAATQNATVKANMNLDLEGGTQSTMKSNAVVQVQGGAQATIKAAIVMIN